MGQSPRDPDDPGDNGIPSPFYRYTMAMHCECYLKTERLQDCAASIATEMMQDLPAEPSKSDYDEHDWAVIQYLRSVSLQIQCPLPAAVSRDGTRPMKLHQHWERIILVQKRQFRLQFTTLITVVSKWHHHPSPQPPHLWDISELAIDTPSSTFVMPLNVDDQPPLERYWVSVGAGLNST
jgi:hypothetical protein